MQLLKPLGLRGVACMVSEMCAKISPHIGQGMVSGQGPVFQGPHAAFFFDNSLKTQKTPSSRVPT